MLKALCLIGALATAGTAQNLVSDPFFRTPSAWTKVSPLTTFVQWSPLHLETRVTKTADAGKTIGVQQTIRVSKDSFYQLAMHVKTAQRGQTGAIPFDCSVYRGTSKVLSAKGFSNEGPDTRMSTGFLTAGTYELRLTTTTVQDVPSFYYRLVAEACSLEPVVLPVANFHFESKPIKLNQAVVVRGSFNAASDSVIYLFSTKKLDRGVTIPGINGQLWLNPASASGIIVSPLVPKSREFTIIPWTTAWPQIHCQLLELTTKGTPSMRLGTSSYSQF